MESTAAPGAEASVPRVVCGILRAMTYNFDPDRWFDNEMAAIEAKKARGDLGDEEFDKEKERLVDEYEKMLERLEIQANYANEDREG
jgi:hypothetical protein